MNARNLVHALPLCCLFLAAADQRDCTIHIVVDNGNNGGNGEGEGEGGEGEGQGDCQADSDCGPGQICELEGNCPPCADPNTSGGAVCDIACQVVGKCVDAPPPPQGCQSDDECGAGNFCDFSQCGQAGSSDGSAPNAPIACNAGVCEPLPPPPPGCQSDAECGPGSHCEPVCKADPTTGSTDPNGGTAFCDNECVADDPCVAECGPGNTCVIDCAGNVTCQPIDPVCAADTDCGPGAVCVNGQCAVTTTACNVDSDCPNGELCAVTETCPACGDNDPACLAPCQVSGVCVMPDSGQPPPPPAP